ncbi:hypothetical protein BO78DRAFT_462451 [Aspergillus sclerotiicarbonarius CBS 121057]|uniref:F-box domain-containing protein n=1 Tax=Aspergillus sclerotiicarbonarius (strain CBS 121057 / IBT 28362) TaxID=1448318 RepID=A0A319E5I7_ASPSB|nr:hypothetical protein BO78DRAFT_462451 [Aspergillus sclerotiicarbonarius CBS 121057]
MPILGLQYDALHTLPVELFETILTYLDVESVKAIRLTNRELAKRCIGPRFLASIQQPVLDVSLQNIRSLRALASNLVLSKKIYSLTFVATSIDSFELEGNLESGSYIERTTNGSIFGVKELYYSPEEYSNAQSDLIWLKEEQEARAQESSSEMIELLQLTFKGFGELDAIHFDGSVIRGRTERGSPQPGEWHPLWMRAWHVLSLVMTAIVQSGVSVKKLDVYRRTARCCIPAGKFTSYASGLDPTQLEILSKSLQSLELSMSGEVRDALGLVEEPHDDGAKKGFLSRRSRSSKRFIFSRDDPRAAISDGTQGITSLFLKSAPALRELDLTFRHTVEPGSGLMHSYDRIIESIAHEAKFPMLDRCAFAGFHAKGESILLFLRKHSDLRSFTVQKCVLTTGSWTPIFAYVEQSMPRLENLTLSNLRGKHMQNRRYAQQGMNSHLDSDDEQDNEQDDEQEGDGMVVLLPIWDTDPLPRGTSFGTTRGEAVHTRTFNREELKNGLVFRPLDKRPGRALGSPAHMNWINFNKERYGVPA